MKKNKSKKNSRAGKHRAPAAGGLPNLSNPLFWVISVLAFFIFFRPLVSGITYPWSNTYAQILLAILFSFYLVTSAFRRGSFYRSPAGAAMLLFFAWMAFSSFFSVYPAESLRQIYLFTGHILLFFIVENTARDEKTREKLLAVLCLSAAVVSVYGIYQYFWGLDKTRALIGAAGVEGLPPEFISRLMTQRAFSTFVYPPALAGFLVVVIPVCFSQLLKRGGGIKRSYFFIALILSCICLVLTFSKGGWIALTAAMLFFLFAWIRYIKKSRRMLLWFFVCVPLIMLLSAAVFTLDARTSPDAFARSFMARYYYWAVAPDMISDYWFSGSGPGTWGAVYPGYRMAVAEETRMAHNNYIQVAVETGPAGLVLFVSIWVLLFRSGLRTLKSGMVKDSVKLTVAGCLAGISAFLAQSFAEFNLYIPGIASTVFFIAALVMNAGGLGEYRFGMNKSRKLLFSAAAAAAALVFILLAVRPMRADHHYSAGMGYLRGGRLAEAELEFKKAARNFPADAKYYSGLGTVYERAEGVPVEAAAAMYEKAVRLNPHSAFYSSSLARLYWIKSEGEDNEFREKAIYYMEKAVSSYPVMPSHRIQLGRMYHLAGMKDDAVYQYEKAIFYKDAELFKMRREMLEEELKRVAEWLEELGASANE